MSLTMVVQAGFIFYRFESGQWKAMRLVETT
jgi:hypothetical protein